ncbi:YicC/YloC family endoribonuclease [Parasedimentitalea psychrophila]|uniref:YicC/YloC family endoribonuclease n=1 Tax=Parasedimentitalea psychrophila TaxID=2997337 RepID=A0A9Y2P3W8_9RHOB|nr:YicC/YloC family endoribonuclease [Parasedimentitalea psychrophila]WIY24689.1 YicC/YloC family endoribonuclease [Parasedimentitalea psychrophila]
MTLRSMTGFASSQGSLGRHSWSWEIRSVNAKGLDLRLRVPDWLDGLETQLRSQLGKALARGNISLALRVSRAEGGDTALDLNPAVLASIVQALGGIETAAVAVGLKLAPTSAADILSQRGVLEQSSIQDDPAPLVKELTREFVTLVAEFVQMRDAEGAVLAEILTNQLSQVAQLTALAASQAEARKPLVAAALQANLAKVLDNTEGVDPARLAQELAILAVKSDVTEEIDRLGAHVVAAGKLLTKGGAVGRKFDFLMQEFNREANTLCAKAQNSDLTATGLELKAIIDQMREQVQNIE